MGGAGPAPRPPPSRRARNAGVFPIFFSLHREMRSGTTVAQAKEAMRPRKRQRGDSMLAKFSVIRPRTMVVVALAAAMVSGSASGDAGDKAAASRKIVV